MALAVIKYEGFEQGNHHFFFDIGDNRYFRFAIGTENTYVNSAVKLLANVRHSSKMMGPVPPSDFGRGRIKVAAEFFDREFSYIQLMSYRTKEGKGPAVSPVLKVNTVQMSLPQIDLPAISLSKKKESLNMKQTVSHIPFSYKESSVSESFFWDKLISLAPKVLPIVQKLTAGKKDGEGAKTELKPDEIIKLLSDPETIKTITDVLKSLTSKAESSSVENAFSSAMSGYSRAMNPAIIALVPAILEAITKLGELGVKINKDELETLQKLNPGVDDPDVANLLNSMTLGLLASDPLPEFRESKVVNLSVHGIQKTWMNGMEVYSFLKGREINIPIRINTPKTIPSGTIHLVVKRPVSNEVIIVNRMKFSGAQDGLLSVTPSIPEFHADDLVSGENYIACITLLWNGKDKLKFGKTVEIPIAVSGNYSFKQLGNKKDIIRLKDVRNHRAYWHKVWQKDFTDDVKRYEFACKYYIAVEGNRSDIGRMETVEQLEYERPHKMTGRMKSGLAIGVSALNELLPTISEYDRLQQEQLEALRTSAFESSVQQAARMSVKFRGQSGEAAAVWVYPEFSITELILQKAVAVNETGNITEFEQELVHFPIPEATHFVGVQTD